MNNTAGDRPPSPPQSTDNSPAVNDELQGCPQDHIEPYTPPRSIKAMPMMRQAYPGSSNYMNQHITTANLTPDMYGDPTLYQIGNSQIFYGPQPTFVRTIPYHNASPSLSDTGINTRSGKALGSPITSSNSSFGRRSRSPKPKRQNRSKAVKKGGPIIDEPLSVLTRDYKLPIKDMGLWVNRPVEDRMKEVEKRNGNIARPMNSFMLYRSAYAERVKQFCKENNHQVVSQVTGASWPLEPKEIREMYERYAIIERDNHQLAHPDYKFAPNKNNNKKRELEEASDDDPDWEGSRSTKRSRQDHSGISRSQSSTPLDSDRMTSYTSSPYQPIALHPSSYQLHNPHGPTPVMVGPGGMTGQYYQRTIAPYNQQIDDVKFGKMDNPFPIYEPHLSLVSLPNADHPELMDPESLAVAQQMMAQGDMLDPRLDQPGLNYHYNPYSMTMEQPYDVPRSYDFDLYPSQHEIIYQEPFHPGLATLTQPHDAWTEANQPGSDFDQEFQTWNPNVQ